MRIVSLCPSLTELVFDLGRGDELVGITTFCVHPADRVGAVEPGGEGLLSHVRAAVDQDGARVAPGVIEPQAGGGAEAGVARVGRVVGAAGRADGGDAGEQLVEHAANRVDVRA